MTGNLFPLKLLHLFAEMEESGVFGQLADAAVTAQASQAVSLKTPVDGLTRLMLTSPEVRKAVRAETGERYVRARLAVPANMDLRNLHQAQFEAYGDDGTPVMTPVQLTELSDNLANAVQVELFHALLRTCDCDIPLL